MTFNVILILALTLCSGTAILLLVRRLTSPTAISECDPDWLANFSTASYRPMQRLLSETDISFLASQPGVDAKTVRKLRSDRRRIFKAYLRDLVQDFHKLHLAARMTLIYAVEDRPDLAQVLLRQRAVFAWAVMMIELRLVLHSFQLAPVDVSGLIQSLENMRMNISVMTPASQSASI